MARSIADLRSAPSASRATRSERICIRPDLIAEVMSLTAELNAIPSDSTPTDEDGNRQGPPQKLARHASPRAIEIREELRTLLDEMAENEGLLVLRATEDGEWRRWADAHPARKEGEPGYDRDREVTHGYCDADALIDSLGTYAYSWEGERLADDDWVVLAANISGPDKKSLAASVVTMHESRLDFPAWRQGLQETLNAYSASVSAATSASAPDAS